jgi:hypothetical protein
MTIDRSSPETALHSLEQAYREKDLDCAIACRNFIDEAKLMLMQIAISNQSAEVSSEKNVADLAEVLKLKFQKSSPPNFHGIRTKVVAIEHYRENIHIITQEGTYADGNLFSQRLFMSQLGKEWFYLCPTSTYERAQPPKKSWWQFWR